MQARTTGIFVYSTPSLENMPYSGMVKATGGSTRTSRIQYVRGFFTRRRNRLRAMMYAAHRPIISDSAVETSVVCKLLTMALPKPLAVKSCRKCSMVSDAGMTEMCPVISLVGRMAMATSQ